MKILVLNPYWEHGQRSSRWAHVTSTDLFTPPIFLAYLTAVLETEFNEVDFIDAPIMKLDTETLIKNKSSSPPDIIILDSSTPSINLDLKTAEALKKNLGSKIVMVGPHVTVFSKEILEDNRSVDFIARGEYEYTVLELCKVLRDGGDLRNVEGLTYSDKNGSVRINSNREPIQNLDELPFPAWHHLPFEKYAEALFKKLPCATMITSRGCPFNCTFCVWTQTMYGKKFRYRSAKNVVDEMEYMKKRYNAKQAFFYDDTFTVNKRRVYEICEDINRRDLNMIWDCLTRVDTVDKSLLEKMYGAGCRLIRYGVESGSQQLIDNVKKGINLRKVEETIKITKKIGIDVHLTFTFGLPGETKETIRQTIDYAKKLNPDFVQFSIMTPFPGTEFYKYCDEHGWIITKDWSRYDGSGHAVIETEDVRKEDLERAVQIAYDEFYMRPTCLVKKFVKGFRSLHDFQQNGRLIKAYIKRKFIN